MSYIYGQVVCDNRRDMRMLRSEMFLEARERGDDRTATELITLTSEQFELWYEICVRNDK